MSCQSWKIFVRVLILFGCWWMLLADYYFCVHVRLHLNFDANDFACGQRPYLEIPSSLCCRKKRARWRDRLRLREVNLYDVAGVSVCIFSDQKDTCLLIIIRPWLSIQKVPCFTFCIWISLYLFSWLLLVIKMRRWPSSSPHNLVMSNKLRLKLRILT